MVLSGQGAGIAMMSFTEKHRQSGTASGASDEPLEPRPELRPWGWPTSAGGSFLGWRRRVHHPDRGEPPAGARQADGGAWSRAAGRPGHPAAAGPLHRPDAPAALADGWYRLCSSKTDQPPGRVSWRSPRVARRRISWAVVAFRGRWCWWGTFKGILWPCEPGHVLGAWCKQRFEPAGTRSDSQDCRHRWIRPLLAPRHPHDGVSCGAWAPSRRPRAPGGGPSGPRRGVPAAGRAKVEPRPPAHRGWGLEAVAGRQSMYAARKKRSPKRASAFGEEGSSPWGAALKPPRCWSGSAARTRQPAWATKRVDARNRGNGLLEHTGP